MTSRYTYRHEELGGDWYADKGDMTVARLSVTRHGQQDRYRYPSGMRTHRSLVPGSLISGYEAGPLRIDQGSPEAAERFAQDAEWHAREHAGQLPLFLQDHRPARETVSELFSARGHDSELGRAHAVMNLVGMAQNFNRAQFGRDLTPSDNVSPYSARLVGNLKERGMVGPEHDDEPTNLYDFDSQQAVATPVKANRSMYDRDIDEGEVRRGRATIRSIVGRRRTQTQGQQGTLF